MKILITGINSFIGTNFKVFSKFKDVRELSFVSVKPEVTDFNTFDVILHLAAIVHQDSKIPENEYFRINRDLTLNLAQKAKRAGVNQFIFLSTIKVFGSKNSLNDTWNEDSICKPGGPYGKSKYEAEVELRKLETPEFAVSIIRTPIVYGPGVKANFLHLVKLVEKFPVLPFAGINNNRHFTYIENLVGFLDRIIETRSSGTFITMDPAGISTSTLVTCLAQYLNPGFINIKLPKILLKTGNLFITAKTERLFGSFYLNNTATKRQLNYEPLFTSEEGLKRFSEFHIRMKPK